MERFQSAFYSKEVTESVKNARRLIKDSPKTCLFVGVLFACGFIPVAIFLAFIFGVFFVLLTCMLVIQGTVIGLSLTALLVFLPGPLCFATVCTILAYMAQRACVYLQPICKAFLGTVLARTEGITKQITSFIPTFQSDPIMSMMNAYDKSYDTEESLSTDDAFENPGFNVPTKRGQQKQTVRPLVMQHDDNKG